MITYIQMSIVCIAILIALKFGKIALALGLYAINIVIVIITEKFDLWDLWEWWPKR